MNRESNAALLDRVTDLFQGGTAVGQSDASLLDRFHSGAAAGAEVAFAVLVERHSAMVLHVCERILGVRQDAEDAAQATFLILARQSRAIRGTDSVAGWLYGVAVRTAQRARRDSARRRSHELASAAVANAAGSATAVDPDGSESARVIHEELVLLPERFRLPIMLHHLEGLTYEQIARQLGCPVRTVQSRLARGRERLRTRLVRRGFGPATALSPTLTAINTSAAVVRRSWKLATVRAAVGYVGNGSLTGVSSIAVIRWVRGGLHAMLFQRVLRCVLVLLGTGFAIASVTLLHSVQSAPAADSPPSAATPPRVTMAGGASIEVVAVSTLPTGPDTWWTPRGARLSVPPVDRIEPKTHAGDGQIARVILVRASGLKRDDMFRWHPAGTHSYWGGRPTKEGAEAPGLEYYDAAFAGDETECTVALRVASRSWKTEVTNDGRGGRGQFVNGHKFSFGKARPLFTDGRAMTVFAVAHNFFGQDRRIVAVAHDGKPYPAVSYSLGSDGDKKWVVDLIDGEFALPPDQIREYQVQFRPIEEAEIRGIALNPKPNGRE